MNEQKPYAEQVADLSAQYPVGKPILDSKGAINWDVANMIFTGRTPEEMRKHYSKMPDAVLVDIREGLIARQNEFFILQRNSDRATRLTVLTDILAERDLAKKGD